MKHVFPDPKWEVFDTNCATGKRRYPTEHDVQIALVSAVVKRNRGRPKRKEKRYYYHDACKGWHLTSQPLHLLREQTLHDPPGDGQPPVLPGEE